MISPLVQILDEDENVIAEADGFAELVVLPGGEWALEVTASTELPDGTTAHSCRVLREDCTRQSQLPFTATATASGKNSILEVHVVMLLSGDRSAFRHLGVAL